MKSLRDTLINSFWLRNLCILSLLLSLMLFLEGYQGSVAKLWLNFGITFVLFSWVVFHNKILVDIILKRKKYFLYVLGLLAGLFLYTSATVFLNSLKQAANTNVLSHASYAAFNTFIGVLIYNSFKYYRDQQIFLKNKLSMLELEQKYLKNQLSPHFLFNTLNNIYSYSLIESKKTPELILKLSELMRYLIQFNKYNQITLKEEIDFIENYIAFERERLEDRCEISFSKQIACPTIKIEPLLFFPMIENAFKHGTNTMGSCFVHIHITQIEKRMEVIIRNKIFYSAKPSTNLGMENVEKRLNLFYKDNYTLNVNKFEEVFDVNLKLVLNG